jgi:thiamine biosynthesis lipoprotein ApbE
VASIANEVLSCSGTEKEGHIVDPATGGPIENKLACWIRLPQDAALADALSTAAMVLPVEKFKQVQMKLQGCWLLLLTSQNGQTDWLTLGDRFQFEP